MHQRRRMNGEVDRGGHGTAWRRLTACGLLVALVASGGCLGVLGGEGLRYTAEPVAIDDRAVAESGFERRSTDTFEYNRTVVGEDSSNSVVVTSHVVTLRKQYRGAPLGHVVAVSSPRASFLGQNLNPLGMVEYRGLVERVLGPTTGGDVDGMERTGNLTMWSLGAERTVARFDASGDRGQVQVFATRFGHGDDYVIVFAVVPEEAGDGADAFRTVLGGVRHDADGS